jgi:hypothetical protein
MSNHLGYVVASNDMAGFGELASRSQVKVKLRFCEGGENYREGDYVHHCSLNAFHGKFACSSSHLM